MRLTPLIIGLAAALASTSVASAACETAHGKSGARSARTACPAAKRFEPYDPDRVRSGGRPGVFSSGGTEIRVGGRTRFEYQYTR